MLVRRRTGRLCASHGRPTTPSWIARSTRPGAAADGADPRPGSTGGTARCEGMASNSNRGNGERAMGRCSDADLYGGVNVLGAGDGLQSQFHSREIHADAVKLSVKKGPNKLRPHKDAMARADAIKSGSYAGMTIVHTVHAVTDEAVQK